MKAKRAMSGKALVSYASMLQDCMMICHGFDGRVINREAFEEIARLAEIATNAR